MIGAKKRKVLFVDYKNELQSHIAESLLEKMHGDKFESYSAGPEYDYVDCDALVALRNQGHDLRQHMSKNFRALEKMSFDYIVILDEKSKEISPDKLPPHQKLIVRPFGGKGCFNATDDQELSECYVSLMQEIEAWIRAAFESYETVDSL